MGLLGGLSALAVATELARWRIPRLGDTLVRWLRPLLKPQETHRITGASFLAWGAFLALLLFGQETARVGILLQAWGDPAATLVGTLWGRHRIRGNKTLEGSLAYWVGACLAIGALSAGKWQCTTWVSLVAASAAALVEALSPPPDDNFWCPPVAAAVAWAMGRVC